MKEGLSNRKRWMAAAVFVMSVFMVFAVGKTQVQAAVYTAETDSSGGINVLKNGKKIDYIYVSGGYAGRNIAVSGSTVYFVHSSRTVNPGTVNPVCTLYQKNMKTGKYTPLKKLPSAFFGYNVDCLYNGSVYLTGWNPSDNAALYRYYVKSKKLKQIVRDGFGERVGKYIVCESTLVHGSIVTYPIYIYNTVSGKKTLVTKKAGGYSVSDGKVYYAETNEYPGRGMVYYTIKYRRPGSGKSTTVAKNVKAGYIGKITGKYVYSQTYINSGTVYYRYSLKTKKNSRMSKTAYERVVYGK